MIDAVQIRAIEPDIEKAYETHMKGNFKPINPYALLQQASDTTGGDYILDTAHAIRDSHSENLKKLDELGLDYAGPLSASYITNMLTEINLPAYTKTIDALGQISEIMNIWNSEWTAEEHPHEVSMRDYALFSGIMGEDGVATLSQLDYAIGGTQQLRSGTEITIDSLAKGFAYLSLQEDATFIAHNNENVLLDSMGSRVHKVIAGNETKHHRFYARMVKAMLNNYPDETVVAIRDVYHNFVMPGEIGIPNFAEMSKIIAISGLFGAKEIKYMQEKHIAKIYDLQSVQVISDEAKAAKEELLSGDPNIDKKIKSINWLQDKKIAAAKKTEGLTPFIIGKTVIFKNRELVLIAP